ncbi:tetratricopeptide repeat protein [Candidatus Dependentiae bacterium]|nr:tetratricopeptide repeat protein [Candidatus Dependentiae bacterium]
MSIIKKALDKAEKEKQSSVNEQHTAEHSNKETSKDYSVKNSNSIDKKVNPMFEPPIDKTKPYIKKKIRMHSKNKVDNILFSITILLMILSLPLFINIKKFFKTKNDFEYKENSNLIVSEKKIPLIKDEIISNKNNTDDKFQKPQSSTKNEIIQNNNEKKSEKQIKKDISNNPKVVFEKKNDILKKNQTISEKTDINEILEIYNDGDKQTALLILKSKYKRSSNDLQLIKLIAELSYNSENYQDAILYYQKLIDLANDTESYFKIGLCYQMFLKNPKKAASYYQEYIKKNGMYSEKVKNMLENIKY